MEIFFFPSYCVFVCFDWHKLMFVRDLFSMAVYVIASHNGFKKKPGCHDKAISAFADMTTFSHHSHRHKHPTQAG